MQVQALGVICDQLATGPPQHADQMSKVGLGKYAELEITKVPEYGERGQIRHFERTRERRERLGVIERQEGILVMSQKSSKEFTCKDEIVRYYFFLLSVVLNINII